MFLYQSFAFNAYTFTETIRNQEVPAIVLANMFDDNYFLQLPAGVYCKWKVNEPPHYNTNKVACAPSEDSGQTGRISLGIRPV